MSEAQGLLQRITTFRQRLEATPYLVPEAVAVDPQVRRSLEAETEAFRWRLREWLSGGSAAEGPPLPRLTGPARRLLVEARQLLVRQRAFTTDPFFAGIAAVPGTDDPLVTYHAETVAVLDSAVRLAQSLAESPALQMKQCAGLEGLLGVVAERLTVQERTLARRKAEAGRVDRLAAVYTSLAADRAAAGDLPAVATLAEELLEDGWAGRPLRFVHVAADSAAAYPGAATFPVPIRFLAAHAINVAQVVARVVAGDSEWSVRPLPAVVAALLLDCGMAVVPAAVVTRPGGLTPGERRVVEAHPQVGAEAIRRHFPDLAPLTDAIAAHHERYDGSGYPAGLTGPQTPSLARLLAIADVYAALNEPRPHRPAHDSRTALTETLLLAEHGQLDPTRAGLLVRLAFYPVGTVVELTDGRLAVVAANHPDPRDARLPARPVVAVLTGPDGRLLPRPEHLDLAAIDRGGILRTAPADRRRQLLASRYPDLC